jgi:CheY-like chemotaxis protein
MKVVIWDTKQDKDVLFTDLQGWTQIQSQEAFNTFISKEDHRYSTQQIYLSAELDWEGRAYSTFYGFELLVELRREGFLCPIFICSYLPRAHFIKLGRVPYGLLFLKESHPFVQLPQALPAAGISHEITPAGKKRLQDGLFHYSDSHGALSEILHHLKNRVPHDTEEGMNYAFDNIRKIINENRTHELEAIRQEMEVELNSDPKSHPKLIAKYKAEIKKLLPKSPLRDPDEKKKENWLVLFVDDFEYYRTKVVELFNKSGITCMAVEDGPGALELLRKDLKGKLKRSDGSAYPPNSICAVISDYRFEEPNGDWMPMQGYDIMDHLVYEIPNMLSLFMLTTKSTAVNASLNRREAIQIRWFAKEDVIDTGSSSAFDVFCSQVRSGAREVHEALHYKPQAKVWTTPWKNKIDIPLSVFYRYHRLSKNYYEKEQWIGQCARTFIDDAKMVKDENLFRKYKKIENLPFSTTFKAGIKSEPPSEKSMNEFYTKLIGRRIAIGLHLLNWDINDISDIMKFQELRDKAADRQLMSSYLALSLNLEDIIPNQLLIEEYLWIQNTLKIALDSADRVFYARIKFVLDDVQQALRDADADDPLLEELEIGNKTQLEKMLTQLAGLCKTYGVFPLFSKKLLAFDQYRNDYPEAFRRNGFHEIVKKIIA